MPLMTAPPLRVLGSVTAPLFSSLQPQLRESVLQWVPKTRVSAPRPAPPPLPNAPNPNYQRPGTDSFYRSAPIKSFIMDTPSLYTPGLICMRIALPGEFFRESLSSAFPPGGQRAGWGRRGGGWEDRGAQRNREHVNHGAKSPS